MFSPATSLWFQEKFAEPTEVQRRGWELITRGGHALLVAPTGSGKTLAAFLAAIDSVLQLDVDAPPGARVLYVSPLKALVYDIERNLRAPLTGICRLARQSGNALRDVRVDVRTGDTSARERQRQLRAPGEILVTTPESLFLLLGSRARANLAAVHTIIVDEIHALAPVKRGAHLALSLERLSAITERDPQRIGLSATVRPLEEVAKFLGGDRAVDIVDCAAPPSMDLRIVVPVPDMQAAAKPAQRKPGESPAGEGGLWPMIYPRLVEEIKTSRATIVFVNSRGLCERLAQKINELAGEDLVRAHHGSVSLERRSEIEEALKSGSLRGIVATSSLELGIDVSTVDRVILVESPGSAARGLQRIGRAGHGVGELSIGRIYPKFRGDLLECAVIAGQMLKAELEAIHIPRNALDVLAQQIVAICSEQIYPIDFIEKLISRAYPYQGLGRAALETVLDMLCGRYPATDVADLRPLLTWDRASDVLIPRRGAALLARLNAGTIPDRGSYAVHLGADGLRIGELDEEMVFETRIGDTVCLGASTWRVEELTRDRVIVSPAPGEPGRLPFWRGDGLGRSVELGRTLGAFVRQLGELTPAKAAKWLMSQIPLDKYAAQNLAAYIHDQKTSTGSLPTDRAITIERFRDELGNWRVCILSPFGARVHAPWTLALQHVLSSDRDFDVQILYTDDGIALRFADQDQAPDVGKLMIDPEQLEEMVMDQLAGSALFASIFRENAQRSLLIPRRRMGQRNPLWAQRLKAQNLLAAVRDYPAFPIVLETYRQILSDIFDLAALKDLLRGIADGEIRVHEVETPFPSPFARSLVFAYVAKFIYEQDAPLAERRAQALTLDRGLLAELLGQTEFREVIDPELIIELERELQQLDPNHQARDIDELHDSLRRLGDLSNAEIIARCTFDPGQALSDLEAQVRAFPATILAERRWIAVENAALYRDALNVSCPTAVPRHLLHTIDNPVTEIVHRYARTHGPFLSFALTQRYGFNTEIAEQALLALEQKGVLIRGETGVEFSGMEWCEADVLRRLKRRTLAKLRRELAPVAPFALAMFLAHWHGLGSVRSGTERLLEIIAQLEGLYLPWSLLSRVLLPMRMSGFNLALLNQLAASGAIVWIGNGSLGARDGRIALYRRQQIRRLLPVITNFTPSSELTARILSYLSERGACFSFEIQESVMRSLPGSRSVDFDAALWDLVWAGQISNDSFDPLRAIGPRVRKQGMSRRAGRSPALGGRWFLTSSLMDPAVTDTERIFAQTQVLLERYGMVNRELSNTEELTGGFGPIYRVLKTMEESGRVRRGYFVEGLAGAQFGLQGAIDRLRGVNTNPRVQGNTILLSALDPANVYGSLIPWPECSADPEFQPRRVAGAWVVLSAGHLVLYAASNGRRLYTFEPACSPLEHNTADYFRVLRELPRLPGRVHLLLEEINSVPAESSPYYQTLRDLGFVRDYRGLSLSR